MSEEKKESRVNIEDLPQAEQELTPEEAQEVLGGLCAGTYGRWTYQLFWPAIPRFFAGLPSLFYGVEYLLHPEYVRRSAAKAHSRMAPRANFLELF